MPGRWVPGVAGLLAVSKPLNNVTMAMLPCSSQTCALMCRQAGAHGCPGLLPARQALLAREPSAYMVIQGIHTHPPVYPCPPAGDWSQALALAPAVSHSYWQQLAQRRVEALRGGGAGSREVLPLMLAAGLQQEACQLLREEGLLGRAADIAAVEAAG